MGVSRTSFPGDPCRTEDCEGVRFSINARDKAGMKRASSYCRSCTYTRHRERVAPYIVHKKDHCEQCGFVAVESCQLDVDHIDGDHSNNDLSNLQTLCANCHRLKSYRSGENGSRASRAKRVKRKQATK